MTTFIETNSQTIAEVKHCHLLPCEIEYTGDANVTNYFESSIRKDDNEGEYFIIVYLLFKMHYYQLHSDHE